MTSQQKHPSTLAQVSALTPLPSTADAYESTYYPGARVGITDNVYGGYPLALAIRGAFETVDAKRYTLFSVLGNFLGPARSTRKVRVRVRRIRDTRTFATRFVEVSQLVASSTEQDDKQEAGGKERLVMTLTADFHVPEPALITHDPAPSLKYTPVDASPTEHDLAERFSAHLPATTIQYVKTLFSATSHFWDRRVPPETVMAQTLYGLVSGTSTTQDARPLEERTSADYVRARTPLASRADHTCALAFYADSGLSYLALVHSDVRQERAALWATLEFALRFHVSDVRFDEWIFREMKFVGARDGRTCSEARYWDEKGRLVCTASQVCILRGNDGKASKAKV